MGMIAKAHAAMVAHQETLVTPVEAEEPIVKAVEEPIVKAVEEPVAEEREEPKETVIVSDLPTSAPAPRQAFADEEAKLRHIALQKVKQNPPHLDGDKGPAAVTRSRASFRTQLRQNASGGVIAHNLGQPKGAK